MEVLVGGLDLLIELRDAFVDVLLLPRERIRLLLDLPLLLVRVRDLGPELLQGFLRGLGSIRRPRAFDPEAVQFLLELLRLFAAAVRHLLFELAQPRRGSVQTTPELFLLGFELPLVRLML